MALQPRRKLVHSHRLETRERARSCAFFEGSPTLSLSCLPMLCRPQAEAAARPHRATCGQTLRHAARRCVLPEVVVDHVAAAKEGKGSSFNVLRLDVIRMLVFGLCTSAKNSGKVPC